MPDVPTAPPPAPAPMPMPIYVPVPTPAPQQGSRAGCAIAILLAFLLAVSVFFNVLLGMTSMAGLAQSMGGAEGGWREKFVAGKEDSQNKIIMIPVEGVISGRQGVSLLGQTENMVEKIAGDLRRAAKDKDVKAILLSVDSPGGEITACDAIYQEIGKYRKEHPGIPIFAIMGDVAASGGYYLSVTADEIWAGPTTLTGSIGVIMETYNVKEGMEKLGVKAVVIKSADKKDILSMAREMTPEERALLQGIVDELYGKFLDVVLAGRKGLFTKDTLKPLADGRVFTGDQAKSLGLVDKIGYLDDVVAALQKKAALADAKVVRYKRPEGLADLFNPQAQGRAPADLATLAQEILADGSPRAMAIWRPGR